MPYSFKQCKKIKNYNTYNTTKLNIVWKTVRKQAELKKNILII